MTDRLVQFALAVLVLVLGAAFEELIPGVFGIGVPILMAAVSFMASCQAGPGALAFAVTAGAIEDGLSSLPPMTSASYFLIMALFSRRFGPSCSFLALAYSGYQVWLSVWVVSIGGEVFRRVLLAYPAGLVTAFVVNLALNWLCRKAAIGERG